MSQKRKPCPGCGVVCQARPADRVCGNCQHKIDRFESVLGSLTKCTSRPTDQMGLYAIPAVPHEFPHIYHEHPFSEDDHGRTEFKNIFDAIARSTAESVFKQEPSGSTAVGRADEIESLVKWKKSPFRSGFGDTILLKKKTAIALRDFYSSMERHFKNIYADGVCHGSDLLGKMISGEITAQQLNDEQREVRG